MYSANSIDLVDSKEFTSKKLKQRIAIVKEQILPVSSFVTATSKPLISHLCVITVRIIYPYLLSTNKILHLHLEHFKAKSSQAI